MRNALQIPRGRMAVLCIDLQEEHRQDARYLVAGFDAVLGNVAALQGDARRNGVPVLHAAYVVDAAAPATAAFSPVTAEGAPAFSIKGNAWTEICAEVRPQADEPVFGKAHASVFANPGFAPHLRAHGIEWLLIAGVWTEACIDATVKDAVQQGIHAVLVKDACGSGSMAMHQTGILNLANRLYGGAVATTRSASALLAGDAAEVWQVEGSVPLRFDFDNAAAIYETL